MMKKFKNDAISGLGLVLTLLGSIAAILFTPATIGVITNGVDAVRLLVLAMFDVPAVAAIVFGIKLHNKYKRK